MRPFWLLIAMSELMLLSIAANAQQDSASRPPAARIPARAWIAPIGIAASIALDPELREWSQRGHSRSLDHFAKSVNTVGTARFLVSAMALSYVTARIAHNESLARGTLSTAAAYVATDLVESALKPVVGRERPHVEGNARRFHPFTSDGNWHSLPSGHVAHITSIAEAISDQTHSASVSVLAGTLVALVSWDRLYEDQHWASDAAVTIVLSSAVSRATVKWLQLHRWP